MCGIMGVWKLIVFAFTASICVEAKWYQHHKREVDSNICDAINNATKIQCYCVTDNYHRNIIRSANCHLVKKNVEQDDEDWEKFNTLENTNKITFSNTMGIAIDYIPTNAIKHMRAVLKLEIKYGNIDILQSFAFANLTLVEEIVASSNQIKSLAINAFSNHRNLASIGLDSNDLTEINRDVFVHLPSLQKLFLTNNKITTIHDKAFVHLTNLKELEIDRNKIFSLNSDTFSGLTKLERLDLTSNNLEVIGDNTFLPLIGLKVLNLDGNRIQMLDEKAFNGLGKLTGLSLAHNNLTSIDSAKVFNGLHSLTFLSFKGNQLNELKAEVIAPILNNFYGNNSSFDVEENNFPCDCRLEWFMSVMNKTQNKQLRLAMENLKCNPDDNLKEIWAKIADAEKNDGKVFEDEDTQAQNGDYEYYDDVQLNGKLFYADVRDLINCTSHKTFLRDNKKDATVIDSTVTTAKANSSPLPKAATTESLPKVMNELHSTTTEANESKFQVHSSDVPKKESTTTRLATVSAKPGDYDHDMASDEARTEKTTKAHRSIQDHIKEPSKPVNNARANTSGAMILLSVILCFRLRF